MSEMRAQKDNVREQHIRKFEVVSIADRHVIAYDGEPYIIMMRDNKLPEGFNERAIRFIADMLVGKRTDLWDHQAIFGPVIHPTREQMTALKEHFNT